MPQLIVKLKVNRDKLREIVEKDPLKKKKHVKPQLIMKLKVDKDKLRKIVEKDAWYKKYQRINNEMDDAQAEAGQAFLRWSVLGKGAMPPPAIVDHLQAERDAHLKSAPDDQADEKPDDGLGERLTSEDHAQDHHDGMGRVQGYAMPLRSTQTLEYHDRLSANPHLLLNDSEVPRVRMVSDRRNMLPLRFKAPSQTGPTEAEAREMLANLLGAYRVDNPEADFPAIEADDDRFSTMNGDEGAIQDPEETESEPMESETEDIVEETVENTVVDGDVEMQG